MRRMLACLLLVMVLTTCISPMSVQAQELGTSGLLEEQQTEGISQNPGTEDADGGTGKTPEEGEQVKDSLEEEDVELSEAGGQLEESKQQNVNGNEISENEGLSEMKGQDTDAAEDREDDTIIRVSAEEVLNYLYIDYPEITQESMQNIVISVGSDDAELQSAVLTLANGEEMLELEAQRFAGNAALFSGNLSWDIGVYQLQSMTYIIEDQTYELSFENSDLDNTTFTVGENEPTYSGSEIEAEIVSIDAEGNVIEQSSIEEAIEAASSEVLENTPAVFSAARTISDVVVVLDPGHDAKHAGARGNGLKEEELTLKIAEYCKAALEKYQGVKVYMTRTGESCPYPGTTSTDCNANRVSYAKSVGADVFVSIHLNSSLSSRASGAEVYYPNDNYLKWVGDEGSALASKVQQQLVALGLADRKIKYRNSEDGTSYPDGSLADYYGVIRRSKEAGFPGIIIEHAFLTNAGDVSNFLNSEEGLKKLGEADARGIAEYFGLSDAVNFTSNSLQITDLNAVTGTFTANLTGISPADKLQKVRFAVWGEAGGQNDLKWYEGKETGSGSYVYQVKVSDHGFEEGTYQVHAYTTDIYGNERILKSATVSVRLTQPTMGSLRITELNSDKGTFQVTVQGIGQADAVSKVEVAVWSQANQSDLKWYTLVGQSDGSYIATIDISNHGYVYGTYNVHCYLTSMSGKKFFGRGTTVSITSPEMEVKAVVNSSESNVRISGKGLVCSGGIKGVKFAVWSDSDGQDDLHWYNAVRDSEGSWICDVDVKAHKTAGIYRVHMYAVQLNGTEQFMKSTTFTISNPKLDELTGIDIDSEKGTFTVKTSGTVSVSGIEKIEVAVWSQSDQKDLRWYRLSEDGEGNYISQINIGNHNYNYGTYNIHAYITTKTGIVKCARAATVKISCPESKLTVTGDSSQTSFRITGEDVAYAGGVKAVRFAVWSEVNGQDDLKWYNAVKDSSGNWVYDVQIKDHKTAGKYQVHMYAVLLNGAEKILKATTFSVNNPSLSELTGINVDSGKGVFTVKASGIISASGIEKIEVAVWSQSDQRDLKWYTLSEDGEGSYLREVNIANHNYNYGTYNIHAYITTTTGIVRCARASTVNVPIPESMLTVGENSSQTIYRITGENVAYPGGVKGVRFAVWSELGGQDDLQWYDAVKNSSGNWIYDVKIADHKTAGKYQVHMYVVLLNGTEKILKSTTFEVTKPSASTCTVVYANNSAGKFSVWIAGIKALSGVARVELAVWSRTDMSDLRWYNALDQKDGTYIAEINIKNHNYNLGTYTVHAYITDNRGIRHCVNSTSYTMPGYTIMGVSSVTVQQMVNYYKANVKEGYPEFYSDKDAPTIEDFCRIYMEECAYEGVKAEVAFCQAMKETNWLRYTGDVRIEQFNFAGIGAVGGGVQGNYFENVRIGVRAQIQHLKAYASTEPLNLTCVDPRYGYVNKGCAPYVEWLAIPDNPYHMGWAAAQGYGSNIVSRIANLKTY